MVNTMEHERGRTSRASSTSSLGREVRCACQYFQSDSLLPERRAMMQQHATSSRPSSRSEQKSTLKTGVCEHEYEPVGAGRLTKTTGHAPVVRIIDTDVVPVADSDDSIDIRGRFTPGPILDDDDLVLPLDGQIEDSAMEGRELGSGYISEEVETAQQLQDRIEERFLSAPTPCTESRTDVEVNTSQVDSSAMEELPLHRGARGLPDRLRSQAGKLRSRLKNIQRPHFTFPVERNKSPKIRSSDKSKSRSSDKSSEKSRTHERPVRSTDKRTRMERIRASLPERPKFSLPDRPKFNFPRKSKFHLPQRPKINLPKIPTRPSFRLPTLPSRRQRAPSLDEQQRQHSNESNAGSRKNLFEFATVPRLFNKKKKGQTDYATSSPKESRAESSVESSTLPKIIKSNTFTARSEPSKIIAHRFTDIKFVDDDDEFPVELERPWKHPSFEKPRRSIQAQESLEDSEPLPWEESNNRRKSLPIEELSDNEELEESEIEHDPVKTRILKIIHADSEDSYEPPQIDPRLYGDQNVSYDESEKRREDYRVAFEPVDPRGYKKNRLPSPEDDEEVVDEEEDMEDEEHLSSELDEDLSARSDREQQPSSGSSCDRRRRGVIEEIDSDEFFLRAKGISQDDMHMGQYLTSEIRDALKIPLTNALADEILIGASKPPQRPARQRSITKRNESLDSYDAIPPTRPKRTLRRSEESDYGSNIHDNDDSISESRHRIVYHAESAPLNLDRIEPLDDIVVVKPIRRKSRTSLRSSSFVQSETIEEMALEHFESPPIVPRRKKRRVQEINGVTHQVNGAVSCNAHHSPIKLDTIPRQKSEPPSKPVRGSSRDRINIVMKADNDDDVEYIEPAPIAPKRHSRSRATSIIQDDDRTSRGAESIPDIGYIGDEESHDDHLRLSFPGYAIIEKRDKPPRPPLSKRQCEDKFLTTPRSSPPKRPTRAYSTLRPRSRTPSESGLKISQERESTPYVELDSEDEEDHKNLLSGEILNKMATRPLPAPPRPPRSRRERIAEERMERMPTDITEIVESLRELSATEAFASTQTDPLPDDLIIEEEITQAKLIVTPSRSGSQIMISTERIPSPQPFRTNIQAISHERIPSPMPDLFVGSSTRSEPDIRGSRKTPEREMKVPEVPPLPITQAIYPDDNIPQRPARRNSSLVGHYTESRIAGIEELEERLSAFLTNETLKIGSLEVGDLKVDKLNVSTLEAHKIAASEIDAIVVSATEISNASQEDNVLAIHPSLLEELIAIKSQLELVAQQYESIQSESPTKAHEEYTNSRTHSSIAETQPLISETSSQQPVYLQLDSLSRTTESRSIFSTQGILPEDRPQLLSQSTLNPEHVTKEATDDVEQKQEDTSRSTSRSCSPTRPVKRETASPIKSLPPVISVTPDTPAAVEQLPESIEAKPQRATISYSSSVIDSTERSPSVQSRPSSPQSRPISPPLQNQHYIAFQTSQIPPQFFTLAPSQNAHTSSNEPSILNMTQQLIRALRVAGKRAMQHFISYIVSRVSREESEARIREVELAICALLLIIVGLIIVCFAGPKTITHHHHWDYFNPPRL